MSLLEYNKAKRGKFKITDFLLDRETGQNWELINAIFKDILVFYVDKHSYKGVSVYYCESKHFDKINMGEAVPEYICDVYISCKENDETHYTVKFVRVGK